jgi:hypothetical protein
MAFAGLNDLFSLLAFLQNLPFSTKADSVDVRNKLEHFSNSVMAFTGLFALLAFLTPFTKLKGLKNRKDKQSSANSFWWPFLHLLE